jgi:hypothetical protein
MTDAKATAESIAKREGFSARKVNMMISLAFLAPDLVRAAIEGQLPHGMGEMTMNHPNPKQPSSLMRAASDAASRVSSWSPAKQKFADKVAASQSAQKEAAPSKVSRAASSPGKK